ncbi:MAG: hypothetical protein NC350_01705 [Corallococcus sp.]|nr:hypothetical protein [Corallococcus sp.]
MNGKVKSKLIYLAVAAAVVFMSISFTGQDVSSREIIIGLGIDYRPEEKQYAVIAEVVSPSGGASQQVGTFSKTIYGKGETMETAFTDMYADTGMTPSLGQCQLLVLGGSLYLNTDVKHVVSYFSAYDAFKDSANVCVTQDDAEKLFQTQMPLSSSVSLAVTQLLNQGSSVGFTSHYLIDFIKRQIDGSKCSCANLIETVSQENKANKDDSNPDMPMCSYECQRIAVFKDFNYVAALDEQASRGYALLSDSTGQVFTVENQNAEKYQSKTTTIGVGAKNVSDSYQMESGALHAQYNLELGMKSVRTGQISKGGKIYPRTRPVISNDALEQAARQAKEDIETFLQAQQRYNVDVIGILGGFHRKYKKQWNEIKDSVSVSDINYDVSIDVYED